MAKQVIADPGAVGETPPMPPGTRALPVLVLEEEAGGCSCGGGCKCGCQSGGSCQCGGACGC